MSASPYYPAFLDLNGRSCVVVGGGEVALRKVRMLVEFGARVQVVAPSFCDEMESLRSSGLITTISRRFEPSDLEGAFAAIAATDDPATNASIAAEARQRRVLVNVVDVPALCDFIVPSYLRRGSLTIAVSTSGASPALARKVRLKLESEFGSEYAALSEMVEETRAQLRREGARVAASTWQAALELEPILDYLRQRRNDEAKKILLDALKRDRKVA